MSSPAPIKQIKVTRYAKAMRAAGIYEWRLVVKPTGEQVLIVGKQEGLEANSDWDDL